MWNIAIAYYYYTSSYVYVFFIYLINNQRVYFRFIIRFIISIHPISFCDLNLIIRLIVAVLGFGKTKIPVNSGLDRGYTYLQYFSCFLKVLKYPRGSDQKLYWFSEVSTATLWGFPKETVKTSYVVFFPVGIDQSLSWWNRGMMRSSPSPTLTDAPALSAPTTHRYESQTIPPKAEQDYTHSETESTFLLEII